ncbi:MAG: trigger factor, partial [bacterium]|nr:trigger factor [bacterium]
TDKPKVTIKELPNSEVEIEGELTPESVEVARKKALKNLGDRLEIPGFRKGHIPEHIIVGKIGEMGILEEAAEIALAEAYYHILHDNRIDAIGKPQVTVTKLAKDNPLGFKIQTAVMPTVGLPEYKALAKKVMSKKEEPSEVTEKEVDDVITEIRKRQKQASPSAKEVGQPKEAGTEKEEVPVITDELAKTLGDFKDLADLKSKIKENLAKEKGQRAKEKQRLALIEELVGQSKIDLPAVLVEAELHKMTARFRDDIEQLGLKFEDYLKSIKKTGDEIRKEWRDDATKRAKLQLILNKIAKEEKIVPPQERVEEEVKHVLSHYKDADPERARIYIESVLSNEKVFELLEGQE